MESESCLGSVAEEVDVEREKERERIFQPHLCFVLEGEDREAAVMVSAGGRCY